MRELTSHKVNGLNEAIRIEVLDEPGSGGACHHYRLSGWGGTPEDPTHEICNATEIQFQNGPIREAGFNGISNEALLAIVEDRLAGFQSGQFACEANADALNGVRTAMEALKSRTRERLGRGVEGTLQR